MYVQVLEKENRVAEAKSNGWGIIVTCLFYLSGASPKNTHNPISYSLLATRHIMIISISIYS